MCGISAVRGRVGALFPFLLAADVGSCASFFAVPYFVLSLSSHTVPERERERKCTGDCTSSEFEVEGEERALEIKGQAVLERETGL